MGMAINIHINANIVFYAKNIGHPYSLSLGLMWFEAISFTISYFSAERSSKYNGQFFYMDGGCYKSCNSYIFK